MPVNTELLKIFILSIVGFSLSFALTPILTGFLYRNKLGKQIRSDGSTPIFSRLHAQKKGTPTMGGVLIWGTALLVPIIFWFLDRIIGISSLRLFNFDIDLFHGLNILTRKETWLPLGALIGSSLVGLVDDFLDARSLGYKGRGIRFRYKFFLYAIVASIGAWWFYSKLGFDSIHIPFSGDFRIGFLYVIFFVLIVTGTSFAVNQTDGLDGLAGGTLLVSFLSYGLIAFSQGKYNLTALIGIIFGALLTFLWFNIYPARFFMGDTGSMGLGVFLAILAFLTNTVFLLPFLGFIFLIEALSYFAQIIWRTLFKKKLLLSAPIHHHFEAKGWVETKVTMRFWIISWVFAFIGIILYFLDK